MFLALVREEHEATYSFLDKAEEDPRPAAEKLLELGMRYLDYFAGLKSPPRFFLMMCEIGIRDDEIREEVQAVHQSFIDAVTRIMAQGVAEGSFRPLDPRAVAQLLKALIDGLAGESAIGVLLTGMGADGARGLREIREQGGLTIAESEDSCVVYGMPRQAIEIDAAEEILSLELIAPAITKALETSTA